MAGRYQKNNADWFPHRSDQRNSPSMRCLRTKYGSDGYAVYMYIRELLASSDFFRVPWTKKDIMLYSGEFGLDITVVESVVRTSIELDILQLEDGYLRCDELIAKLSGLIEKRGKNRSKKPTEATCSDSIGRRDDESLDTNFSDRNSHFSDRNSEKEPKKDSVGRHDDESLDTNFSDRNSHFSDRNSEKEPKNVNFSGRNATDKIRLDNTRVDEIRLQDNISTLHEGKNLKNISLSPMTAENSRKPPSSGGERETFFDFLEIFFFRRLPCPFEETERFVNHYEKTGWVDSNGCPIKSRAAAARNWQPKKGETPPRGALRKDFVDIWADVFQRAKLLDSQNAYLLLTITKVDVTQAEIVITLPKKLGRKLGPIWAAKFEKELRPIMLSEFSLPVRSTLSKI